MPNADKALLGYGGNTSCVEVRADDGTLLVLDAGTGARALGATILGEESLDILLTHFHMDHVLGLGFFAPLFDPGADVGIWGPPSATLSLRDRLARYLSPPLFPLRIRDFACRLKLRDAPRGLFSIGGFDVAAELVCHPNPTLGYRISDGNSTLAYIPDHEVALGYREFPTEPQWTSGFDLAENADLLIHDSQYADAEYDTHVGWGHSSVSQSLAFAEFVGAKRLMTFHHDPSHDDAALDRLAEQAREGSSGRVQVVAGKEGAELDLAA